MAPWGDGGGNEEERLIVGASMCVMLVEEDMFAELYLKCSLGDLHILSESWSFQFLI